MRVASQLIEGSFHVIIFDSTTAANPQTAQQLRIFVAKGNGVVLTGLVPLFLGGTKTEKDTFGDERTVFKGLQAIADWFGCSDVHLLSKWESKNLQAISMIACNGVVAREAQFGVDEKIVTVYRLSRFG